MRILTMTMVLTALCFGTALAQTKATKAAPKAAPKSLALKDLPAADQKTVEETLKGGEIKSISKETEDGVTQYEIESMLNGKHRDFNVDTKGKLIVVEEETTIDSVPAAAKATIMKKVGDGKLGLVETFTKPDQPMMYEAAWKTKAGKGQEVLVNADGTLGKS